MTRRNEGIIALLMVLALVAFIIGSAIGISISLEEHDNVTVNNTTHVENVTQEMLSGAGHNNDTIEFDYETDYIDFNDNYTRELYNLT